jgi:hypothetical protein
MKATAQARRLFFLSRLRVLAARGAEKRGKPRGIEAVLRN